MLASDDNNPNFVGSRNPDDGLFKEFFWFEAVDGWASAEQSREQQKRVVVKLPKVPYIRIMVPGDKTTEVVQAVTEPIKRRFPREWMAWQIDEGLIGGDADIPGWKLSEWPELDADTVRELLHMRFQTVEQLAGASDKQIQGIGMGGVNLREKARVAMRNRMGEETRQALETKDAETQALKDRLAALEAILLNSGVTVDPAPELQPEAAPEAKRGPGRPAKAESAVL